MVRGGFAAPEHPQPLVQRIRPWVDLQHPQTEWNAERARFVHDERHAAPADAPAVVLRLEEYVVQRQTVGRFFDRDEADFRAARIDDPEVELPEAFLVQLPLLVLVPAAAGE